MAPERRPRCVPPGLPWRSVAPAAVGRSAWSEGAASSRRPLRVGTTPQPSPDQAHCHCQPLSFTAACQPATPSRSRGCPACKDKKPAPPSVKQAPSPFPTLPPPPPPNRMRAAETGQPPPATAPPRPRATPAASAERANRAKSTGSPTSQPEMLRMLLDLVFAFPTIPQRSLQRPPYCTCVRLEMLDCCRCSMRDACDGQPENGSGTHACMGVSFSLAGSFVRTPVIYYSILCIDLVPYYE